MTRVLFVEESADLRAVVEDAFGEVGYDVAAVEAGRDALATVDRFQPDLVIYDRCGLGNGSADDIDDVIRRLSSDGNQPVIVLGDYDAVERAAGRKALCLSAPLDIDALIVAAAGLLSGELVVAGALTH